MLFPADIEYRLGFDRIRQRINDYCHGDHALELAKEIEFSTNRKSIELRLDETSEMMHLLRFEGGLPAQDYTDIRSELQRIHLVGTVIDLEFLFALGLIMRGIDELRLFFNKRAETQPCLYERANEVPRSANWAKMVFCVLNDKGEMRDSASEALSVIRQSIKKKHKDVDKMILSMIQHLKKEGVVAEDSEIALRNNRLVIPIPASSKRRIRGVIHDESATGQTVYIEPLEVFDLNNDIQELESDEKREIRRILAELTDSLRPELPDMAIALEFLAHMDLIRALAKIAIDLDATKPDIIEKSGIELHGARHPLLVFSATDHKRVVVPLSIELNDENRVLIISGPNAGGKSVAMKTVGLLQYMFQCGLLIPVVNGSRCGFFDSIFADIGDQQSIENDLSTYSGHLMNLKQFMDHANDNTLVLMDELGSGTEPESGGAIAEAILGRLVKAGIYGVITTHYFNLKMFATRTSGVVNGAMLYDRDQLRPTYILRTGNPGSSFALEIARNTGISESIIAEASDHVGSTKVKAEEWIQNIETEKELLRQRKQQMEIAEQFVTELIEKYNHLNDAIKTRRDQILADAKKEAIGIINDSRRVVEKTISDIKTAQAEKTTTQQLRQQLEIEKEKLEVNKPEPLTERYPLRKKKSNVSEKPKDEIEGVPTAGDCVRMNGSEQTGEVILISGQTALVVFGNVQIRVPLSQLVRLRQQKVKKNNVSKGSASMQISDLPFSLTLDLRGKRAEEALPEVERFIDQAMLKRVSQVFILHGRGFGILRKIIRQYLNGLKDLLEYEDEQTDRGGDGVTVVVFKRN